MKTFLLKDKVPILKWGKIPDEVYFEGEVPAGYSLAVCPHKGYIILDIDRHGKVDGFKHLPDHILTEVFTTLTYKTPNNGRHAWFKYTGDKELKNKTSKLGIDLRTEKGYVKWHIDKDIRSYIHLIKPTSLEMNEWLESLFF